jgi:hypothetical protein
MYIKALLALPKEHPSIKSSPHPLVPLLVYPISSNTRSRVPRRSVAHHEGTTLSYAPVMSRDRREATLLSFCHVAWICCISMSSAVSVDIPGRAPICWGGSRLCSSERAVILLAPTASRTFPSVFRRATGHQGEGAELSPLPGFLRTMVKECLKWEWL